MAPAEPAEGGCGEDHGADGCASTAARQEQEANAFAEAGHFRKAAGLFARAAGHAATPRDAARLHEARAQCLLELDELAEAVAAAAQAAELRPDWAAAHATHGRALLNAGCLEDAVGSLRRACLLSAGGGAGAADAEDPELAAELKAELAEARALLERHWSEHHDIVLQLPPASAPALTEARHLRVRQYLDCRYCHLVGEQGPGGAVWAAGVVLAAYIAHHGPCQPPREDGHCAHAAPDGAWSGVRALELGAGTGVAGLAAAAAGAKVLLTDREPLLQLMQLNAELNSSAVVSAGGSTDCAAFDWSSPPPACVAGHAWDVVLAADLIYSFAAVKPLVDTLAALLGHGPRSAAGDGASGGDAGAATAKPPVVIYAHAERSTELDAQMHAALAARGLQARPLPAPPVEPVGNIGSSVLKRVAMLEILRA